MLHVTPPTCPETGSKAFVRKDAAVDSVYPYPSTKGQQTVTFKKSNTSFEIGAAPDSKYLVLPPNTAFAFAKSTSSFS